MPRSIIFLIYCSILGGYVTPASAHDHWINRGSYKNAAGELCCGAGDCGTLSPRSVTLRPDGYHVDGIVTVNEGMPGAFSYFVFEVVPESDVQPSPDGRVWRCHRPDQTRRCFFAPPPGS